MGEYSNSRLGVLGETAAVRYLENKGFKIVTRNFRAVGGEIDIVALDGDTTVFVEVKTRSSQPHERFGRAARAVDTRKQRCLISAIKEYQSLYPESVKCRTEIAEVYSVGGRFEVKMIKI